MAENKLNSRKIASFKTPGRLNDGAGLYLECRLGTDGALHRSWLFRYKHNGKPREMGLGSLSESNGLFEARQERNRWRTVLREGGDPIEVRKADRTAKQREAATGVTFREAATEFLALQTKAGRWRSEATAQDWKQQFAGAAATLVGIPRAPLGEKTVRVISDEDIEAVLKPTWHRPVHGVRLRRRLDEFWRWAIEKGYATSNPARLDRAVTVLGRHKRHKAAHFTALPYSQIGSLMRKLRTERGTDIAGAALEFCVLTAVRTKQVVLARWCEIDMGEALWRCPGEHTKNGEPLEVPLSGAAMTILKMLPGDRDPGALVFPGSRNGAPLGRNSMRRLAQDKLGYGKAVTAHGMRSTFRDWVAETRPTDKDGKPFPAEAAEAALHHAGGTATELAYKRTRYLAVRRGLMEAWAAYCGTVVEPIKGADIIPLVAAG
jgi:integrase